MISLGADLAATFGGTAADAVEALGATLRGEYDSSEKYGLGLSAATVQAELAAKGQDKLTGTALATAKAQATLDIATKNAAGSMGQFARETGTAAGAQEIANAKYEDAKAALGEKLLPVMAAITSEFAKFADWISKNTVVVGILVGVIGGLAGAVLARLRGDEDRVGGDEDLGGDQLDPQRFLVVQPDHLDRRRSHRADRRDRHHRHQDAVVPEHLEGRVRLHLRQDREDGLRLDQVKLGRCCSRSSPGPSAWWCC